MGGHYHVARSEDSNAAVGEGSSQQEHLCLAVPQTQKEPSSFPPQTHRLSAQQQSDCFRERDFWTKTYLRPHRLFQFHDSELEEYYNEIRNESISKHHTCRIAAAYILSILLWVITYSGLVWIRNSSEPQAAANVVIVQALGAGFIPVNLLLISLLVISITRWRVYVKELHVDEYPMKPLCFSGVKRGYLTVCCSEWTIFTCLLTNCINNIAWRVSTQPFSNVDIETTNTQLHARLVRSIAHLYNLGLQCCVLTTFLFGRGLYMSSNKIFVLMIFFILNDFAPMVQSLAYIRKIYNEDILTAVIHGFIIGFAFCYKIRIDLRDRQWFYMRTMQCKENANRPNSKMAAEYKIYTTGIESTFETLNQIQRLVDHALGSPGTSLLLEYLMLINQNVYDVQKSLAKFENLFKIHVTSATQLTDPTLPMLFELHGLTHQTQRETERRTSNSPRDMTTFRESSNYEDGDDESRRSPLASIQLSRLAASPRWKRVASPTHFNAGSQENKLKDQRIRMSESHFIDTHDNRELGGYRPEDIPERQLEHVLEGVVGYVWTIDFQALNKACEGNILVEVGYHLIGEKVTQIVQSHPDLIDPDILLCLDDGGSERLVCSSFQSSSPRQSRIRSGASTAKVMEEGPYAHFRQLHHFVLMSFLYGLQEQYRPLPYHSAVHASHVAHSMLTLMNYLKLHEGKIFTVATEIGCILAALGHDVGHPGKNNQYFVNSYDPLSVVYNDSSVLENYHCCLLFMTLELENCNVLFPFTTTVFRHIRELIIRLILVTDMKNHFQQLSKFKLRQSPDFDPYNDHEDLYILLEMCIKAGDLASSACEWPVHRDWCLRVVEEFYRQGEQEVAVELPISPLCDRSKHATDFAKSQAGFIDFVAAPLFHEIQGFDVANSELLNLVCTMTANSCRWQQLASAPDEEQIRIPDCIRKVEGTEAPGKDGVSQGINIQQRRWTSAIGDINIKSPMGTLVTSISENVIRNPNSTTHLVGKQKKTIDAVQRLGSINLVPGGGEDVSIGELMSSSSWEDDAERVRSAKGGRFDASRIVPLTGTELGRHLLSSRSYNADKRSSESEAETRLVVRKADIDDGNITFSTVKLDLALSPSARVAHREYGPGDRQISLADTIRKRARILRPLSTDYHEPN